ncbi:MAG: MerR family transcriptional regulator [Lachnospiraceae bacterium]|nr:MerR family transcriptional regulator [Lachnospiraceae bacterium]
MKDICLETGLTYEALKFYCNQGLVPNVKRNKNNYRIFDEHDLAWIKSLDCLKKCGMSIQEMKEYLALCLQGQNTIPERKTILAHKKEQLLSTMDELQNAVDYIDWKQGFYDDILSGKTKYFSSLIKINE